MKKAFLFITLSIHCLIFSVVSQDVLPDWSFNLFHDEDETNSKYFRIPALITLSNGDVLAAVDGRIGSTYDSPNNVDPKLKMIVAGTQTGKMINSPYEFLDHPGGTSMWETSASLIDPCIVEDAERGRIYMLIDAFTWEGGLRGSNVVAGTGFKTIGGNKYLALTKNKATEANDRDITKFQYTVREDGIVWDDQTNTPTDYKMNSRYELLQKTGDIYQPLFVNQLVNNNVSVPMNVFYQRSLFRILRTSYLFLFYSDDYGTTWSDPINLNNLKKDTETHFLCGTGKGLQLKTGRYKGRVMLPVYFPASAAVIYTDDGITWKRSAQAGIGQGLKAPTESELVEMPEGHVAMFSRTSGENITVTYSYTGGASWLVSQATPLVHPSCKISAVGYSALVDGKPAVLISYPNKSDKRENGSVAVGLISITGRFGANNPTYSIEWKTPVVIEPGSYAYSCMVELPDGKIGILAENYKDVSYLKYMVFSPEKLISGTVSSDIRSPKTEIVFRQVEDEIFFETVLSEIGLYNLSGVLIASAERTDRIAVAQIRSGVYIMRVRESSGYSHSWKLIL